MFKTKVINKQKGSSPSSSTVEAIPRLKHKHNQSGKSRKKQLSKYTISKALMPSVITISMLLFITTCLVLTTHYGILPLLKFLISYLKDSYSSIDNSKLIKADYHMTYEYFIRKINNREPGLFKSQINEERRSKLLSLLFNEYKNVKVKLGDVTSLTIG